MPNNCLSVLYKHIIQVENKNVGLKVGDMPPPPFHPKYTRFQLPPPPPFLRQWQYNIKLKSSNVKTWANTKASARCIDYDCVNTPLYTLDK